MSIQNHVSDVLGMDAYWCAHTLPTDNPDVPQVHVCRQSLRDMTAVLLEIQQSYYSAACGLKRKVRSRQG